MKDRDGLLLLVMIAASILLDAVVMVVLFSCEFIHLYLISFMNFPAVVLFAVVAMLALNLQLILIPSEKNRFAMPVVHWLNTLAALYFILQLLVVFGTGFLSPVFFTVLSLLLLMGYVVSLGLVLYSAGTARTWGKNGQSGGGVQGRQE